MENAGMLIPALHVCLMAGTQSGVASLLTGKANNHLIKI